MNNPTAGPWKQSKHKIDRANGGEFKEINATTGWIADVRCNGKEEQANTNLIIAAPDMYAVLKDMIEALDEGNNFMGGSWKVKMARDAIDKAEGRYEEPIGGERICNFCWRAFKPKGGD